MIQCKCGLIKQCLNDPEVPILRDRDTDAIAIQLTPGIERQISYCFFCGGKPQGASNQECRCGELDRCILVDNSAIGFDNILQEFSLQYSSNKLPFYYCPFCGGTLRSSRRDDKMFVDPSLEEMEGINERLRGITTINGALQRFGEPDQKVARSEIDVRDENFYKVVPIKETLLYTKFRTVHLCIQEAMDGKLLVSFIKKAAN